MNIGPDVVFLPENVDDSHPDYYDDEKFYAVYASEDGDMIFARSIQNFRSKIRYVKVEHVSEDQLLNILKNIDKIISGDAEDHHRAADALLLSYIGNIEITEAFKAIKRWYA